MPTLRAKRPADMPHWTAPMDDIEAYMCKVAIGTPDKPKPCDDKQRKRERKAQRAARKANR